VTKRTKIERELSGDMRRGVSEQSEGKALTFNKAGGGRQEAGRNANQAKKRLAEMRKKRESCLLNILS